MIPTSRSHLALIAAGAGAFVLTAPSAQAVWTLLDNFDSYDNSADTRTSLATERVWQSVFDNGGTDVTGNSNIVTSDKGQSLQTAGGTAWRGAEVDLTQWGAGLADGATGSYFFQIQANSTGGGFDIMIGLSDSVSTITTTDAWRDFAAMPFVNGADNSPTLNLTNAGLPGDDVLAMTEGTWYNVWLVVDNSAQTVGIYTSTGENDGNLIGTASQYRSEFLADTGFTNGPLNAFGVMASGGAGSELLLDNLQFSPGVDTSFQMVPEPSVALLGGLGILGLFRRRR